MARKKGSEAQLANIMWRDAIKARRTAKLEQKKARAKAWSAANLKAAKAIQKTVKF